MEGKQMMLSESRKGVLTLVRNALLDEKMPLPEGADFGEIAAIAKKHSILNMVYYGAANAGVNSADEVMQGLFMYSCTVVAKSTQQLYELDRVFKAFEENGIDYMPLKGSILKKMYPKSDMRSMGDADILIRTSQYHKAMPIMADLGFHQGSESDHEYIWKNKSLLLELHKHLIPSYNKDYYAYFGDGWGKARLCEGSKCRYEMSREDQFIYLFCHFAKHYRSGGIGIKHLTDIYIYRKACPDMDEDYIVAELKKLVLDEFYGNVLKLIDAWLAGGEFDEKSEFIMNIIFDSGAFGNAQNQAVSLAVRESKVAGGSKKAKGKRIRQIFFPSLKTMKIRYHILDKAPILLPFMWVVRGFDVLLFRRKNIKRNTKNLKDLTPENIENFQQSLLYVGLDYNFKE